MRDNEEDDSLPRSTPTGVPHLGPIVLPSETHLKTLKVTAELSKLREAPRAYIEKIKPAAEDGMNIDEEGVAQALGEMQLSAANSGANTGGMTLTERFEKIQGARPGLPPGAGSSADGPDKAKKTLRIVPRLKQNARSRRYNR